MSALAVGMPLSDIVGQWPMIAGEGFVQPIMALMGYQPEQRPLAADMGAEPKPDMETALKAQSFMNDFSPQ